MPDRKERTLINLNFSFTLANKCNSEEKSPTGKNFANDAALGIVGRKTMDNLVRAMGRFRNATKHIILDAVAVIGVFATASAFAAPPPSATVNIDPKISTPGNVMGELTGDAVHYAYTVDQGATIADTIPVQICTTSVPAVWTSINIDFQGAGGGFPGTVTLPATQTFVSGGATCKTVNITFATGALNSVGNFAYNINITEGDTDPHPFNINITGTRTIHLRLAVLTPQQSTSCYLTDSSGLLLSECDGTPVSASGTTQDARFVIVANKKMREVATNPGQFYYNLVWKNRGSVAKTVNVDFVRTGVLPHGAQAIHAWVGNAVGATLTPAEFDNVNAIGVPEGADDKVSSIAVAPGNSLIVTYHLTYAGIGSQVPTGCATTCPLANQYFEVLAKIYSFGNLEGQCRAGALGYLKSGS